jgi:hypothetical protein
VILCAVAWREGCNEVPAEATMTRFATSAALVSALVLSQGTPAMAANRPTKVVQSAVAKVRRGAMRVALFGGGLGSIIASSHYYRYGQSDVGAPMAAAGGNMLLMAFKKNPTEGLLADAALTAIAATGAWVANGAERDTNSQLLTGATLVVGSTFANFGRMLFSYPEARR